MAEKEMQRKKLERIMATMPEEKRKKLMSIIMSLPKAEERLDKLEELLDEMVDPESPMTEEAARAMLEKIIEESEEQEKKEELYEKKKNIVKAICAVIGIGLGIKYYFMSGEYDFFVSLISTAIATAIIEAIGIGLFSVCVANPEDI